MTNSSIVSIVVAQVRIQKPAYRKRSEFFHSFPHRPEGISPFDSKSRVRILRTVTPVGIGIRGQINGWELRDGFVRCPTGGETDRILGNPLRLVPVVRPGVATKSARLGSCALSSGKSGSDQTSRCADYAGLVGAREKGDRSNLCEAPFKGRPANWTCPLFQLIGGYQMRSRLMGVAVLMMLFAGVSMAVRAGEPSRLAALAARQALSNQVCIAMADGHISPAGRAAVRPRENGAETRGVPEFQEGGGPAVAAEGCLTMQRTVKVVQRKTRSAGPHAPHYRHPRSRWAFRRT